MSFANKIKQDLDSNKEHHASNGTEWFKFVEGDNVIRILTEPVIFFEKYKVGICYTDCGYQGTAKYLAWVLDRADGKVKLMKIPYGIAETIGAYEADADYTFSGFPMPYDIKISAKGAGTKEVAYTVLPKPAKALDNAVLEDLKSKHSVEEIIVKMKEKQLEKHKKDGTWEKEQARKKALKEEMAEARANKNGDIDTIEYPTDDIDPKDIPF